ncbi:HNH endonuclease signature motif containing protein [Microbacterium sp. NC79]|uniref:HNH endonuclease signature motif containing protein n=1 Tax=Microbacterium sp. NC79 TaxID=2851009 RepID=UPI001C2CA172|nr:HNH endonuclease signature motif containing protein [Microbacterium sp. NC79]MBV0895955.1 HNH endonuclease [Microbacterium sp. NC79]
MSNTTHALADATHVVRESVGEIVSTESVRALTDDELRCLAVEAGQLLRSVEAALIEVAGEVEARSQSTAREERFSVRHGCARTNEFLQRATGVSAPTAAKWFRASAALRGRTCVTTGEALPGALPKLRQALACGATGVDGILAIAGPMLTARDRADAAGFASADTAMALVAITGDGTQDSTVQDEATQDSTDPDAAPQVPHLPDAETARATVAADGWLPVAADVLKVHAHTWATWLDQDGAEPADARAAKQRGITLGAARDGLIPINGLLLPEVAAQFARIDAAINNPRLQPAKGQAEDATTGHDGTTGAESGTTTDAGGVRFVDSASLADAHADRRTAAQRRHDALATVLGVAAASEKLPTIGGAAPTLVVRVTEEELTSGRGWAQVDNFPVSLATARHTACSGAIQRVTTTSTGRITRIETEERVFNRHQRRAIALRDGGCIIPGCSVTAAWCEIHHVTDHARGGPTHTDNGVLLCWHHHRYLDTHGWNIRMRGGIPEVCPPRWIDPQQRWRPARPPGPPNLSPRRT